MLSEQRQYEITQWICREGKASINELAEHFGVSGETVRRDLNVISKDGRVRRVHGGAVAVRRPIRDESYAVRQIQSSLNKQRIGEAAARRLRNGDIVGIDSGTCAEALARAIYHVSDLTVITHSLPVATILAEKLNRGDFTGSVLLLSGIVNPETRTLQGTSPLTQLQSYHLDKAFVAVTALSEAGAMAETDSDGKMSYTYIRQAEAAYLLAESKKLGQHSFYRFAELDELTALITDDEHGVSRELKKVLDAGGTELCTVPLRKVDPR